jgi:hypothetical protein
MPGYWYWLQYQKCLFKLDPFKIILAEIMFTYLWREAMDNGLVVRQMAHDQEVI